MDELAEDMTPLFQMIVDRVPPPDVDLDGPFQMQISALDYSSYVGVIGIGRISRGKIKPGSPVKSSVPTARCDRASCCRSWATSGWNAWK